MNLSLGSSPASKLPPETLRAIFGYFLHLPRVGKRSSTTNTMNRAIVSISCVCSLWRDVALDFPELWAHVNDRNAQIFNLFLQRSRNTPLHLYLNHVRTPIPPGGLGRNSDGTTTDFEGPDFVDPSQAVKILQRRIRSLHVAMPCPTYHDVVNLELPSLECVVLDVHSDKISHLQLFGEDAPSIRALSVNSPGCVRLRHTEFPRLAHLHVHSTPNGTEMMRILWFFSVLSHLPEIRTLHISRHSSPADAAVLDTLHRGFSARLQNLRSIVIIGWSLNAALQLLTSLDFPSDCKVRLDGCFVPPRDMRYPIHVFRTSLLRFKDVSHLEIAVGDYNVHLAALGENSGLWIGIKQPQAWRGALNSLPVYLNKNPAWRRWVYDLLIRAHIPLRSVTSCHMHVERWGAADARAALLQSMTALRTLDLSGLSAKALAATLALLDGEVRPDSSSCTRPGESHPDLEEIVVELFDGDCSPLTDTLAPWAARRKALGLPLRHLAISVHPDGVQPAPREFREALDALAPHVDDIEVRRGAAYRASEFVVHPMWSEEVEHGYWEIPDEERPRVDASWMRRFEKSRAASHREFRERLRLTGDRS